MLLSPINPKIQTQIFLLSILLAFASCAISLWLATQEFISPDTLPVPFLSILSLIWLINSIEHILAFRQAAGLFQVSQDMSLEESPFTIFTIEESEIVKEIETLGFSFLGKIGIKDQYIRWLYVDKLNEAVAIIDIPGVMCLCSLFEDGFSDETFHSLKASAINSYKTHRKSVKSKIKKHGNTRTIDSIETWLNWQKVFGYQETRKWIVKRFKFHLLYLLMLIDVWTCYLTLMKFQLIQDTKTGQAAFLGFGCIFFILFVYQQYLWEQHRWKLPTFTIGKKK